MKTYAVALLEKGPGDFDDKDGFVRNFSGNTWKEISASVKSEYPDYSIADHWLIEKTTEKKPKAAEEKIEEIRKVIRRYFEVDPWTTEKNPEFDEDYTAQEVVDEIVDILA